MDEAESIYSEEKLLVRAMDFPQIQRGTNGLEYNCNDWANEFCMLMDGKLTSASSTLIVPGVGVSTYKNIGFLIDSDLANCFHIAKSDSCSSGNISDGDFHAAEPDFKTINELANYISTSGDTTMNEVNINASIDSVVGLFFNECPNQELLLQMLYVAKECIKDITGLDYPIYSYDSKNGRLNRFVLTDEVVEQITQSLKSNQLFYWLENYDEPVVKEIGITNSHVL